MGEPSNNILLLLVAVTVGGLLVIPARRLLHKCLSESFARWVFTFSLFVALGLFGIYASCYASEALADKFNTILGHFLKLALLGFVGIPTICFAIKMFDRFVHSNCEADRLRRAKELCDANPSVARSCGKCVNE